MLHSNKFRSSSSGKSGFTLIELLAVMMIMGILGTVVTTAYVGMMRGAGMREAVNQLRSEIILARQKAITDANKVILFFEWNDSKKKVQYYMVQAAGTTTKDTVDLTLKDTYNPSLQNLEEGSKIFNLKTGKSAFVTSVVVVGDDIHVKIDDGAVFNAENIRYGFLLHTENALPEGFVFNLTNPEMPEVMNLTFYPDGTVVRTVNDRPPEPIGICEANDPKLPPDMVELIISEYGSLTTKEQYK